MSKKPTGKNKVLGAPRYRFLKVLCATTILVACSVVCFGGIDSGARTASILYRCLIVTAIIGITFGFVIKAVASYEETHSG
jgi:heme/copper-type cytochrome/quinol oxidase subunit 3